MSKKIKVILLDNVKWMWNKGTVLDVAPAYFKNVLERNNLAKKADANVINIMKQKEEKKNNDEKKRLKDIYEMLSDIEQKWWIIIEKQATAMNHLYDKIAEKDISNELLMRYKVKIDKTCFIMESRIESLWEYIIKFEHESIKKKIKVIVVKKK